MSATVIRCVLMSMLMMDLQVFIWCTFVLLLKNNCQEKMMFVSKVLYFNFSWFTCRICGEFLNFLRKSCDRQFVEVSLQCSCRCSYLLLQSRLTSQGHLYHDELVSGKTLSDPLRWISLIINKSMRSMKRAFHIWIEREPHKTSRERWSPKLFCLVL